MTPGKFIFWFVVALFCAAVPPLLIPAAVIAGLAIYGKVAAKRKERQMFAPPPPQIHVQPEQLWRNPGWRA